MKSFLNLVLFLVATATANAAATGLSSPVLTNFNEQSFLVDLTGFPTNIIKINPNLIGVTNITVTNINTTTINASTNVYQSTVWIGITNYNTYLTTNNFVINGTNVAKMSDLLWTNIAEVLQPTSGTSVNITNVTANTVLATTGAFIIRNVFTTNLVAGDNNINPNNASRILVNGFSSTPGDSTINLSSGNGSGQFLYVVNYTALGSSFCIYDGTSMWDGGGVLSLPNGNWCPTRAGETLVLQNAGINGWQEVGRFGGGIPGGDSLWLTNFASASISPKVAPTLMRVGELGDLSIGLTNIFQNKDIGIFHRTDLEGSAKAWINIGETDSYPTYTLGSEWWANTGTNDGIMDLSWFNGIPGVTATVVRDHIWTVGEDSAFFYYETKKNGDATFFLNGETGSYTTYGYNDDLSYSGMRVSHSGTNGATIFNSISDGVAGQPRPFNFDYNGTNLWEMTINASAIQPLLIAHEPGSGNTTTFGQVGGIGLMLGVTLNLSADNGDGLILGGNSIQAYNSNGGLISHFGYVSGTGSSSIGISHTGTNGAAIFNSSGNGDAGTARDFVWQADGINKAALGISGPTYFLTNAASGDGGYIGVGTGEFVLRSQTAVMNIGNSTKNFVLSAEALYPNSADMTVGGDGVEWFATWTEILKLKGITKAQKTALTPKDGMLVYQTDNTPGLRAYVNGAWVIVLTAVDP